MQIDDDGGVILGEILEVLVLPSDTIGKWMLLLETLHSLENYANIPTVRYSVEVLREDILRFNLLHSTLLMPPVKTSILPC